MKLILIIIIIVGMYVLNGFATIHRLSCKIYAEFSITLDGMTDASSKLKSLTSKTKRQCLLECISLTPCKSVNYKTDGGNCELLERSLTESIPHLTSTTGWTYLTTNDEDLDSGSTCKRLSPCVNRGKCTDICEPPGFNCTCTVWFTGKYCERIREFASCKAVYEAGFRNDGVYYLTNMGYHYCVLSTQLQECGSGGWTLILKTEGSKTTFRYEADYWTTSNVYNQIYGLRQGLSGEEAKFDAFNKLSFTKVCIGMRENSINNFLQFSRPETSMLSLMQSGTYKSTNAGRSKWLGLLAGSLLQPHCNREGFNNYLGPTMKVRIGIFGNNEGDCITCDSVMGIGIGGTYYGQADVKTGVHATYTLWKKIKSKGFILVM